MSMEVVVSVLILIVGLVVGMPIPFAFGGSFLWLTYSLGFNPSTLLASGYTQINSTILLAIPLFVLAGKVMEKGHIGDALICYNSQQARETEEGTIFSGKTKALLNGKTEIEIYIECDPVKEASDQPAEAHIVGYEPVNDPLSFMRKGMLNLEAGDKLQFLFDLYDDEGNLIETTAYGPKVRVFRDNEIAVKDEPFGKCDLQFGGMLTDIYQRTFLTETLETHVD